MEELKCTPSDLKELIDDSELIGRGFFAKVFTYKDRLIKLDSELYDLLKNNDRKISDEMFGYRYRFNRSNFGDIEQINTLVNKQKSITLTKLPQGIVNVDGIIPGIIIPYHRDHHNLSLLTKKDYRELLIVLRKLLLSVQELADNQISQSDLHSNFQRTHKYNVLYKDSVPQIIDLDGDFVTCGKYFKDAKEMYNDLGEIVFDAFQFNGIKKERHITPTSGDIDLLINEFENEAKRR